MNIKCDWVAANMLYSVNRIEFPSDCQLVVNGSSALIKKREPEVWQGTGLPPVGAKFEYMVGDGPWYEAEMRYIMQSCEPECWYVIAYCPHLGYEQGFNWKSVVQFRAIRTKEQIEAEERENQVKEIRRIMYSHLNDDRDYVANAIYDAGFRKQPKEDA